MGKVLTRNRWVVPFTNGILYYKIQLFVGFPQKQQSNRVPEWKKRMQNLEKEAKGTNIVGGAVDKIAARI